MSDEINWEPQQVADLGVRLSRFGSEYRTTIAEMYKEVNAIGVNQLWVGRNFNLVVAATFNRSLGLFEEWANYMQLVVPQTVCGIAETQKSASGVIEYSLENVETEIKRVEETVDKGDGSQKLNPAEVRNVINNSIPGYGTRVSEIVSNYLTQFEELATIKQNKAIDEMANELNEILIKTKSLIEQFSQMATDGVEKTIQNVEVTDEETRQMAARIASIVA